MEGLVWLAVPQGHTSGKPQAARQLHGYLPQQLQTPALLAEFAPLQACSPVLHYLQPFLQSSITCNLSSSPPIYLHTFACSPRTWTPPSSPASPPPSTLACPTRAAGEACLCTWHWAGPERWVLQIVAGHQGTGWAAGTQAQQGAEATQGALQRLVGPPPRADPNNLSSTAPAPPARLHVHPAGRKS